jgi:hypothetical protein
MVACHDVSRGETWLMPTNESRNGERLDMKMDEYRTDE